MWMHYALFFLPNLLLAVDCALNRRELTWFFILGFLGPIGVVAYLIYFWESITFPFPLARAFRAAAQGKTQKRCPHCNKWVDRLYSFQDGRQGRQLCSICRDQLSAAQR
jgi:hypothetical protein